MARFRKEDQQKKLEQTRQCLLDAAAAEFARAGYPEANINTISTAAGFAKGTIYNYFSSKRALMLALIDSVAQNHLKHILEQVRSVADPISRLERFFHSGFEFVSLFPSQARVALNIIYGADTDLKAYIYQAYQPMFQFFVAEILEPGINQGIFRPVELMPTTMLLMTIYLGTASQVDIQSHPFIGPAQVTALILDGLRK
jgi:AcrR family transcriptional regulator